MTGKTADTPKVSQGARKRTHFNIGGQDLTVEQAVALLWRYKRVLEGLTPGGSEFVNDPERCAEHAKKVRGMERKMGYRDAIRDAAKIADNCTFAPNLAAEIRKLGQ